MKHIFCLSVLLVSATCFAQVARTNTPPPDEIKLSGSVLQDNSGDPYQILIQHKYRHGDKWSDYTFPTVRLNKSCDTLQLSPYDDLKIVQIGPNYYKVVKSGVEYHLEFLYRKHITY